MAKAASMKMMSDGSAQGSMGFPASAGVNGNREANLAGGGFPAGLQQHGLSNNGLGGQGGMMGGIGSLSNNFLPGAGFGGLQQHRNSLNMMQMGGGMMSPSLPNGGAVADLSQARLLLAQNQQRQQLLQLQLLQQQQQETQLLQQQQEFQRQTLLRSLRAGADLGAEVDITKDAFASGLNTSGVSASLSLGNESTKKEESPVKFNNPRKKVSTKDPAKKSKKKHDKDRPKRPLSAYNLFFKEQRARLLTELGAGQDSTGSDKQESASEPKKRRSKRKKADSAPDEDKDGIHQAKKKTKVPSDLPSDQKKKKGSTIGFADLAKTIASKWKTIDKESLAKYTEQAAGEKKRYASELAVYQKKKGKPTTVDEEEK